MGHAFWETDFDTASGGRTGTICHRRLQRVLIATPALQGVWSTEVIQSVSVATNGKPLHPNEVPGIGHKSDECCADSYGRFACFKFALDSNA